MGTWGSPGDARWVLGCEVALGSQCRFGKLGVAQSQVGGRSHGCIGRESGGVGGEELGKQPSRVSQNFVWGTGLPGAGVCGTGRGDWVPAGTPGKTPNVSHSLW